jgi:hypothetical protein
MGEIIGAVILGFIAIACFVCSYLQFHEKGFLFNNAYIYASKQERETMDKRPYYMQSGVVSILIGIIFSINAVEIVLQTDWMVYLVIVTAVIAILYAVVLSVKIEKKKRDRQI